MRCPEHGNDFIWNFLCLRRYYTDRHFVGGGDSAVGIATGYVFKKAVVRFPALTSDLSPLHKI
jgi:hypothetical protein